MVKKAPHTTLEMNFKQAPTPPVLLEIKRGEGKIEVISQNKKSVIDVENDMLLWLSEIKSTISEYV